MLNVKRSGFACLAALLVGAVGLAQEPPQPGPEHKKLKELEGTWDCIMKMGPEESKAVATYKMDLGGLWLVSEFEGDFGGMKFRGRGLDTYDAAKKKHVALWADSMSTTPMIMEGTYDKDKKTITMTGEGPGMDGKPTKFKSVVEYKDDDSMVFTLSSPDKDGKDQAMITISYKRKK